MEATEHALGAVPHRLELVERRVTELDKRVGRAGKSNLASSQLYQNLGYQLSRTPKDQLGPQAQEKLAPLP